MADKGLSALFAEVQKGLELIDTETADAIIGETGDDYKALIEAMDALQKMGWKAALTFRMKNNRASRKVWAQQTVVALQLVHYAYALGKVDGQRDDS